MTTAEAIEQVLRLARQTIALAQQCGITSRELQINIDAVQIVNDIVLTHYKVYPDDSPQ